MCYFAHNS